MDNKFEYTYSAPTEAERKEIASIRRQYVESTETTEGKLERIRRLDARVKNGANAVALAFGVIGTLIAGLGMAMVLEWNLYFWGILVGIVGFCVAIAAYPVYRVALKRGKQKYGEEILRLSEELLKENE